MEEKNNYVQTEEVIVNFRKIWDNIIQYWWVCLITVGVMILAGIGLTVKEHITAQNINSKAREKYQAVTMIYMEPEELELKTFVKNKENFTSKKTEEALDKIAERYSENVELTKSQIKNNIEQWYWNKNNLLMYDCMALINSDRVVKQISDKLKASNMKPYNVGLESIKMEILNNSRCFTLTVRGNGKERVKLIANTATEILINEAKEILNVKNSKIIDKAVVNRYRKTENVEQPYEIITDASVNILDEEGLSIKNFISKKNLLLIIIGAFSGFGIIFVLILLDKKIHTKDEIERYFNVPFLGEITKKDNEQQLEVVATVIANKCKYNNFNMLMITSPEKNENINNILEVICEIGKNQFDEIQSLKVTEIKKVTEIFEEKDKLKIIGAENLCLDANVVEITSKVCQIIIIIKVNYDKRTKVEQAINNAKAVGGNIIGYILINN